VKNPYEVLQIREGATVEEIKIAYKKLVKKYHPDQYINNPLSDLAEEKLKEVNEAYDNILNKGRDYEHKKTYNDFNNNSNDLNIVRNLINQKNYSEALKLLEKSKDNSPEWNYLYGVLLLRKGWYERGYFYINNAVKMNPNNEEYVRTLRNINTRNQGYKDNGNIRGYNSGPSMCEVCQCLICTDCCCECFGGDLISCC